MKIYFGKQINMQFLILSKQKKNIHKEKKKEKFYRTYVEKKKKHAISIID